MVLKSTRERKHHDYVWVIARRETTVFVGLRVYKSVS